MASDAAFRRLLKGRGKLTILVEIKHAYETGSGPAEGTIYIADREYTTKPTDSPPNRRYREVGLSSPELVRSIDAKTLGGRGESSIGQLVFDNADGRVDFLLNAIIDGREVSVYAGDRAWARSEFRLITVATVQSVRCESDEDVTVLLRGKEYLLDDTIIGDPIPSGPNAGKPKPLLLGRVRNFDIGPYLVDAAAFKYYISNFPLAASVEPNVREMGISLRDDDLFFMDSGNATADTVSETINCADHLLNINDVIKTGGIFGLSSGVQYWVINAIAGVSFQLSLTKGGLPVNLTLATIPGGSHAVSRRRYYMHHADGVIELSAEPKGRVTVDMFTVDAAGAIVTQSPHQWMLWLLQNHTKLPASAYDAASITALATLEASEGLTFGRAVLDRMNVQDIFDAIARTSRSWYREGGDGVMRVGRLDLANLDSVEATGEVDDARGDLLVDLACENMPLPWGKVNVNARRNVVVQTDGLSPDTTLLRAEDRSKYSQSHQIRVSTTDPGGLTYPENWWDYHASAIDSKPLDLEIDNGYQNACDEITDLFRPWTRLYRATVGLDKCDFDPGDCVTLRYPRYGLEGGKKTRVLTVNTRLDDREVDLVLVRQETPDYTTTDFH